MKAILTVGVSASGKSTWTDKFINEKALEGVEWRKIERDCIRRTILLEKKQWFELDWSKWDWKWEPEVTEIQDRLIESAAQDQISIVISDTNLNKWNRDKLTKKLEELGYVVELKEFEVSYEEAVLRDAKRKNGVGPSVIAKQLQTLHHSRLAKKQPHERKRQAIIVDVDGTLAHKCDRDIYDASKALDDFVDEEVATVVDGFEASHTIIVVTGRKAEHRDVTEKWLKMHHVPYSMIFTRADGDNRSDEIIKEEIYKNHIEPEYDVKLVIDDRPKVCRMWRSLGLKVLQCGNPYIEF